MLLFGYVIRLIETLLQNQKLVLIRNEDNKNVCFAGVYCILNLDMVRLLCSLELVLSTAQMQ